MADDFLSYFPRNPRHQSTGSGVLRVEIERLSPDQRVMEADLVDFSRDGFRLRSVVPLAVNELVTVRFRQENAGLDLCLAATVRWQRPEAGEKWLAGFESHRRVDWETLGELFLRDVLAVDGSAQDAG